MLRGVCVAMSCGGGGFSPDDAYDSAWDSVMPTKGNPLSITSSTKTLLGVLRRRVVVTSFSPYGAYGFCMGQRKADERKIHHQLHPVPLQTLGVFACSLIGSAAMMNFAPTTTTTFSSS